MRKKRRRRRKRIPTEPVTADIIGLSHDGRGIAKVEGKTVFVDGALPGEKVIFKYVRCFSKFDEAVIEEVLSPSPDRVEPLCKHFLICGGCSLQHMRHEAQLKTKLDALLEQLEHFANTQPNQILDPITGPIWGYRRSARLGAKLVPKKGGVLVGFREKHSSFIADIKKCEVLQPVIGENIESLRDLISSLSVPNQIPQIEVAVADNGVALVIRHLEELTAEDLAKIAHFGEQHGFIIYLQSGGPNTIKQAWPRSHVELFYDVEDVRLFFRPGDFIQINQETNRKMIAKAMELLCLKENDKVLDLFCGIGNFSLPIAKRVELVTGIEGSLDMVNQATLNGQKNNITNAIFKQADLTQEVEPIFQEHSFNKILLDPPRCGAKEIIKPLAKSKAEKILYISCNPATLARDAGMLISEGPYELEYGGIIDMFPHTAHAEAIALFNRV